MPVTNWWIVDDIAQRIITGPVLWDGVTDWSPPAGLRAVPNEPPGYTWQNMQTSGDLAALTARVAALETRLTTEARGVASLPAIALLQTIVVRVRLKTPMPSASFTPSALLVGTPVVGNLTVMATAIVDRQNVDVSVRAAVAVNLGQASVLVFADAN